MCAGCAVQWLPEVLTVDLPSDEAVGERRPHLDWAALADAAAHKQPPGQLRVLRIAAHPHHAIMLIMQVSIHMHLVIDRPHYHIAHSARQVLAEKKHHGIYRRS